jgi:hypothetical protein
MAVTKENTGRLKPSLERRIAEARERMERQRAEGIDPEEEWRAAVRRLFDRESLIAAYREWMACRGKVIEEEVADVGDEPTDQDAG